MNTDAIELICEKLGTTIENLVPAVIEYINHTANIGITVSAFFLAIGVALIIAGIIIDKKSRYIDGVSFDIIGFFVALIGLVGLGFAIYNKHIVTVYPTITAYKEILSWVKGS